MTKRAPRQTKHRGKHSQHDNEERVGWNKNCKQKTNKTNTGIRKTVFIKEGAERVNRNIPLEKWQSHCSEKVNEIDFSKGVPKSRNWKFAPPLQRNRYFCRKCAFFAGRGARPVVIACPPWGDPKITEISINFWKRFEWALGGNRDVKMTPLAPQGSPKGSQKLTLGALWDHFWA